MDPLSFGFLVLMVVLGGAIAYFGDWLGRKIGKKRLHIRGVRPRHFAAISTTVVGALIPLVTILLVMLASEDARRWFFEGRQAIRLAQERVQQLREKTAELQQMSSQVRELEGRRQTAVGELKTAQQEVARLTGQREELRKESERLRSERDRLDATSRRLQASIGKLEKTLRTAEGDLDAARTQLALTREESRRVVVQRDEAAGQLEEVNEQYLKLDQELQARERDLRERQQQVEQLTGRLGTLATELRSAESDLTEARLQLDQVKLNLETERIKLDEARTQANALLQGLKGNLAVSRIGNLIIPRGEELARVAVLPRAGVAEARVMIERALQEASNTAKERGAQPSRSGTYAELRDQQVEGGPVVTVADQAQQIVNLVLGQQEETVIIAYSFWNVFSGESVPLVVNAFRNPLVYKAGQVITERRIDGMKEEEEILRQITSFLENDVRSRAIADRMIPAQGREQGLGSVSPETIFNLVTDIRRMDRYVRLQAVARTDTRAADPLQLDFRIR